jgi:mono/diheme cytochrome c family protein
LALAYAAGKTPLRKESAGLGAAALAVGFFLLLQGRTGSGLAVELTASNPVEASDSSVTKGNALYIANCMVCHGATGQGDGPSSGKLTPAYPLPADFTTSHSRSHYDGEFFNWIKSGKINTAMPAFGGTLTDEDIWNVINYLRWMQSHPGEAYPSPVASPTAP